LKKKLFRAATRTISIVALLIFAAFGISEHAQAASVDMRIGQSILFSVRNQVTNIDGCQWFAYPIGGTPHDKSDVVRIDFPTDSLIGTAAVTALKPGSATIMARVKCGIYEPNYQNQYFVTYTWNVYITGEPCTVTFDRNDGSGQVTTKTVWKYTEIGELRTIYRDGYTHFGWYTSPSGGRLAAPTDIVTGNITLYARWLKNATVTLNAAGGTVTPAYLTVGITGTYGYLPTPTRDGYTFDGWYTAFSGGTKVTATDVVSGDITLYAHWLKHADVNFYGNGGTVKPYYKTYLVDRPYGTLPEANRDGYMFIGWYTSPVGGIHVTEDSIVPAYSALYAQWIKNPIITFDPNGGTVDTTQVEIQKGDPIGRMPVPVRNGYQFIGWYTKRANGAVVTNNTTFNYNQTIYARWDKLFFLKTDPVKTVYTGNFTAILTQTGDLWMWGSDQYSMLGNGTDGNTDIPQLILRDVMDFQTAGENCAALKKDGSLWIWGSNSDGQIGNGTRQNAESPYNVMNRVTAFSLGEDGFIGAIASDGLLWLWGNNEHGQVGDGTYNDVLKPKSILKNVKSVYCVGGLSGYTAIIGKDKTLWMWGCNDNGQLATGNIYGNVYKPNKVMDNVSNFYAGEENLNAVIKTDNTLWVWGYGANFQIGDDSAQTRRTPVKVMKDVKYFENSNCTSAAITTGDTLYMWGGNGIVGSSWCSEPTYKASNVASIEIYPNGYCAYLTKSGSFTIWNHSAKTTVNGVTSFQSNGLTTALIMKDGSLKTIGANDSGQAGAGWTSQVNDPYMLLSNVNAASCGYKNGIAQTRDGSIWMWGDDTYGQLGNEEESSSRTPIAVHATPPDDWFWVDSHVSLKQYDSMGTLSIDVVLGPSGKISNGFLVLALYDGNRMLDVIQEPVGSGVSEVTLLMTNSDLKRTGLSVKMYWMNADFSQVTAPKSWAIT